ncbi:MAG: hypothetical protein C0472_08995, partial [Erythrobacter sp.]|nr:hypothetical protein [Erythrobacter sp.]
MSRRTGIQVSSPTPADDAEGAAALPPVSLLAGLGGGVIASALVLWFATGSAIVALAFVLAA